MNKFLATSAMLLSVGVLAACSESEPKTLTTTSSNTVSTSSDTVVNPDGTKTTTYHTSRSYMPATTGATFNQYAFSRWDLDHDGIVSPAEWETSTINWYGPTTTTRTSTPPVYQTYTYWDKNGDGRVDSTEFSTAATSTNLYNTWETNSRVLPKSPNEGQFVVYDVNGDGKITPSEWQMMRR